MALTFPPLLLITDPAYGDAHTARVIARVATELPAGAFAVQYRAKGKKPADFSARARELRRLTEGLGVPLLINGDPATAAEVGADGVHLGRGAPSVADARRSCGPETFVSVSAHTADELRRALIDGANAVLVSPIYASPGKGTARGTAALREAKDIGKARFLVYALGGIEADKVSRCRAAGADGVAVIRALLGAKDVAASARALYQPWAKGV
ncbi:MAG: thiamine phosphate synthase [Myxococcales bacterium]|nr:thiamine phosphate synthase [Myxococcales bacterium]